MMRVLLALGLGDGGGKGNGGTVFVQSHVKQHAELMWILSCTASMGYLGRMTQWKVRFSSHLIRDYLMCSGSERWADIS